VDLHKNMLRRKLLSVIPVEMGRTPPLKLLMRDSTKSISSGVHRPFRISTSSAMAMLV